MLLFTIEYVRVNYEWRVWFGSACDFFWLTEWIFLQIIVLAIIEKKKRFKLQANFLLCLCIPNSVLSSKTPDTAHQQYHLQGVPQNLIHFGLLWIVRLSNITKTLHFKADVLRRKTRTRSFLRLEPVIRKDLYQSAVGYTSYNERK